MKFDKIICKYPYLLLLLIAVVGYFQVAFLQHPLKWDMTSLSFPWRNLIADCLQKHSLPWWNPYQNLGYPLHADPQSGAWYPVVWLIGYFYGYDIYSLSLEFVLHIFLAGVGMYLLCRVLKLSKQAAFFSAASYLLCGFFIGNAQHCGFIVSATWIPFVLAYFFKIEQNRSPYDALRTGFFLYLLLTGGYLAFAIIMAYFLLFLFFGYVFVYFRAKKKHLLPGWIKLNALALLTFLLLSAVFLVSVFSSLPYFTRGNGITLQQALICPFSPQCSLSFLLPYAVITDPGFFATDLSMSNAYFGIIPLIFFVYSFFTARTRLMKVFLVFGIFTLLAAFGAYVPVRAILYYTVPLMNLFRLPGLFRLFSILSFVLLAGFAADRFLNEDSERQVADGKETKGILKIKWISVSMALALILLLFYSVSKGPVHIREFFKNQIFSFSHGTTVFQHMAVQSCIQLTVLAVFFIFLFALRERKMLFIAIALLSLADLVFSAWLNGPYTVFDKESFISQIKKQSEAFPADYPMPVSRNTIAIADTGMGENTGIFFKNINTFYRQPAFDGYNPFFLKNLEYLEDSFPGLFFTVLKNRTLFLTEKHFPLDSIPVRFRNHRLSNTDVYLDRAGFEKAKNTMEKSAPGDTVRITLFSPSLIRATTRTNSTRMVTLLQNNYPGWTLRINGKKAEIFGADYCFMSALVPPGENELEFSYSPSQVFPAFFVSAAALLVLSVFFGFEFFNAKAADTDR